MGSKPIRSTKFLHLAGDDAVGLHKCYDPGKKHTVAVYFGAKVNSKRQDLVT